MILEWHAGRLYLDRGLWYTIYCGQRMLLPAEGSSARTTCATMPQGDCPTRGAIFDALCALCIPVFFSSCVPGGDLAYELMYHPFLPRHERTSWGVGDWAVVLNMNDAHSDALEQGLRNISSDAKRALRERISQLVPRIQFADPWNATAVSAGRVYADLMAKLARERG